MSDYLKHHTSGQWAALARLHENCEKQELRGHPRFLANSMNCEKGIVSDFSATGLRITYKKCMKFEKGDRVELELYSPKGMHTCAAEVMWTDRKSRKCFEVGFQFLDANAVKKMRLFDMGFDALRNGMLD